MSATDSSSAPAPLVAVLCWLIPGSGYFLIGQKMRGAVIGITIIAMFIFGVLLAGVRVIDVPGFDDRGFAVYYQMQVDAHGDATESKSSATIHGPPPQARWSMVAHPFSEITNKPWYVPQVAAGPICLLVAHWSNSVAHAADSHPGTSDIPRSHGRIYEIGTLYTAIAGMLNLLAIIDAASRQRGKLIAMYLLAYQLFLDPLPVWDYWPWLLLPLTIGVSIVYKSVKCRSMTTVPREAAAITFWILASMFAAGAVLWGIVAVVDRF